MKTTSNEQVGKVDYTAPVLADMGNLNSVTLSIDSGAGGSDVSSVP